MSIVEQLLAVSDTLVTQTMLVYFPPSTAQIVAIYVCNNQQADQN